MTDKLIGTGVALVTPFKPDNSIDYSALGKIVEHVIKGGVDFIVALGTTGESVTLNPDEKKEVVDYIKKKSGGRVPLVIGIGGNNTASVLDSINTTNFEGIAAILTVAPYYNKPTQEGLYRHFSEIAMISPRPLILYNVPGRTGSNLSADTTLRLANNHSNIVAIKEASRDLAQIMKIIHRKPDHFNVLSGDDAFTLPMIYLGGSGVISVIANARPSEFSEMVRAALKQDNSAANELHYKLLDLIIALFEEGSPAGVKAALAHLGLCGDHVRLPLVSASDTLKEKIAGLIEDL